MSFLIAVQLFQEVQQAGIIDGVAEFENLKQNGRQPLLSYLPLFSNVLYLMYTLREGCIRAVFATLSRFSVKMFFASFILSTCSPLAAVRSGKIS